ncbi:hypothetical protein DFH27DRAFT_548398 [Peziza echinospora]|nr:hypothetical protein DFH27DRAFT_548398 [Peziza echinospora]
MQLCDGGYPCKKNYQPLVTYSTLLYIMHSTFLLFSFIFSSFRPKFGTAPPPPIIITFEPFLHYITFLIYTIHISRGGLYIISYHIISYVLCT